MKRFYIILQRRNRGVCVAVSSWMAEERAGGATKAVREYGHAVCVVMVGASYTVKKLRLWKHHFCIDLVGCQLYHGAIAMHLVVGTTFLALPRPRDGIEI
jgi:hypothetical protein